MFKRFFCFLLIAVQTFSLVGCSNQHTISKDHHEKILIIGNSHSVDAFHLLYQAYMDQFPEQHITIGVLYYSGCSISRHVEFGKKSEPVYRYYLNNDGSWKITNKVDMKTVLEDQPWDTVFLQAAKSDLDETLNKEGRRALESLVDKYVTTPHNFMWHTSWPSPNDDIFFSPDYVRPAPDGYKENLINLYGFNPITQFTVLTDMAKKHILNDSTYSQAICTGASIMHTHITQGIPQIDIWRDYTHLNDYGRLIAAYSFVAQLTNTPISEIGIDKISVNQRHSQYKELGDLIISEEMKQTIIEAANYSLQTPWKVPEKK